jgi:cytochrome c biogenesis protein CcmG/thiol:disulfide interchange protein DsbE
MRSRRLRLAAAGAAVAVLLAVVAVGIVLAGGEGGSGKATPTAAAPRQDDALVGAPDLRGVDPITGKDVSLADFRGKPVVVNVWASWCPDCNEEAADLRDFAAAHPEAVVLGLDFQDTRAGAREFYSRWRWTHPSIWDVSGTKAFALGLVGMPTTYFLDERHRIVAQVVGATDRAGFERGLELAKQS